jgi:hypothetical protein
MPSQRTITRSFLLRVAVGKNSATIFFLNRVLNIRSTHDATWTGSLPPLTFGVIAIESRLIHGWKHVGLLPDEAPNKFRAGMAETQQANTFIVGAAFPEDRFAQGKQLASMTSAGMSEQFTRNRCSALGYRRFRPSARRRTHSGTQIDFLCCLGVLYCAIRVAVSSCKRLTIHRSHGDNTGSNPVGDAKCFQ